MKTKKSLTRKDLQNEVKCQGYIIDYLHDCGRLPIVQESKGHGYPRFYDPSAVDIVKQHLAKRTHKKNT